MKIIEPVAISDAMLLSSSVPENDAPAWSDSTSYSVGQRVLADHRVYEAIENNVGMAPALSPAEWIPVGASNRWRMFDARIGSVTSAADAVSVTVRPGLIGAIALIGVSADSVTVSMVDSAEGVVFEESVELQDTSVVRDWFGYFFEPISVRSSAVIANLPPFRAAEVTVTIQAPGAIAHVGELVFGRLWQFAPAFRYGSSFEIQDFSRKDRDPWGTWSVGERDYSHGGRWPVLVRNDQVDDLIRVLARLRARPAVYIGSPRWDAAMIYGFYRSFDVVISYPTYSELSIEIEGLT